MLLLPPLFPLLRDVYSVSYTDLAFAYTAFSVATGIAQAPAGFIVDRYGARRLLLAGLVLESVAIAMIGLVPVYEALIVCMILAGLANAVFHPADYSILNALVGRERMGRAFSIHTASGHLGDAVGPITIITLATAIGWQAGFALCGLVGGAVAAWLWFKLDSDEDVQDEGTVGRSGDSDTTHAAGIALLMSLPVLTGLVFFFGLSLAGRGMSGFGVATLDALYGIPLAQAGVVLSCYLFASPAGVLVGGFVADRVERHDLVAVGCFLIAGACALTVGLLELPLIAIGALFATAGLFSGMVAPSRDMLIRAVTPPGQMGKVFGFVSTGFNLAGIVGPLLFAYILDHSNPRYVFFVIAAFSLFNVTTVLATGLQGRRNRP